LEGGIDGLLHISNLGGGRRLKHPREVVKEWKKLGKKIDKINKLFEKGKEVHLIGESVD